MVRTLRNALPLIVVLAACSSPQFEGSGFLDDYSKLKHDPDTKAWMYVEREGVLGEYDRILMDPIEVRMSASSDYSGDMTPEEFEVLAGQFLGEFLGACDGAYPFVPEPEAGVLRMRVAITDVVPMPRLLDDPEWESRNLAAGRLGSASIEIEFLDSVSGESLGAFAATRSSQGYTAIIPGEVSRYGKALGAFRTWAENLRAALDEAHGV